MNPGWPFMWSKTGEDTGDYWSCMTCARGDQRPADARAGAEAHVIATGHTVRITHIRQTTLEGVATSAIQPHV